MRTLFCQQQYCGLHPTSKLAGFTPQNDKNAMHIVDLSHRITPEMPVFPGDPSPSFKALNTCERDGFRVTMMHLGSHTGTHVDTPAHLYAHGETLGDMPLSQFVGSAFVIDCSDLKHGEKISMDCVAHFSHVIEHADFLLFRTGWDRYWGEEQYFHDYPVLSTEVAHYITGNLNLKGIGFDTPSVDSLENEDLTLHKLILNKGLVIFENLTGLDAIGDVGLFTFCALPLPCYEIEASPVRAVAFLAK